MYRIHNIYVIYICISFSFKNRKACPSPECEEWGNDYSKKTVGPCFHNKLSQSLKKEKSLQIQKFKEKNLFPTQSALPLRDSWFFKSGSPTVPS